jgi:hypothetical protein
MPVAYSAAGIFFAVSEPDAGTAGRGHAGPDAGNARGA